MNQPTVRIGRLWLLLLLWLPICTWAQSAGDLLQDAIYAEDIEGNLDKAIGLYDQVVALDESKRPFKAQALFRMGLCYLKKNDEAQAKLTLERLQTEFADQTHIIEKAQTILADLSIVDPASLMPPSTLAYAEIGNPGKQVETILNMLTQGGMDVPTMLKSLGGSDGDKSPSEMVSALLNPSMMEELKKIRGMAAGMIGFADNKQGGFDGQGMVVLYPGESDALRGFLEAGIRMAAKADETVAGMETLTIKNQAFIALDDQAIFVSQSRDQLVWAVEQYKGVTHHPSLANQEDFFGRVSKKARQDNTFTLWLNANDLLAEVTKLVGQDELPDEFHMVDNLVDLKSMDELMVSFAIKPDGLHLDAQLNLIDGHQCLPYNLIRTPNLSANALQGIPEHAIILASFALGADAGPAAQRLEGALTQITGLDVGREIFANLEQINMFMVPPTNQHRSLPPEALVSCLGLSLTSHDPQQTQALLQRLLGTVHQVVQPQAEALKPDATGLLQYNLSIMPEGNAPLAFYLGQRDKTTILSLDKKLATTLIKGKTTTPEPLEKPITQVVPETSKLVCANVGGVLLLADTLVETLNHNPQNPGHEALRNLALACAKTTVQIRTDEAPQSLRLHLALDDLPGLDSIVGPAMMLSQIDINGQVKATQPKPKHQTGVLAEAVSLSWRAGVLAKNHRLYWGTHPDQLSLIGETKTTNANDLKLPSIDKGKTYHWRVDEVWEDGTVIAGSVWTFKTAELLAHYNLGNNAQDESGHNNHGTLQGAHTWIDGPVGQALLIRDNSTYVEIPGDMSTFEKGFTFALWAKPTGNGRWARFLDFGSGPSQDNITFGREGESDTLILQIYRDQTKQQVMANNVLTLNDWHHYTATCDEQGKIALYKDGKRVGKGQMKNPLAVKRTNGYLAKSSWHEAIEYRGGLDDVRIYDTALSAEAITSLYHQGTKLKEAAAPQEQKKAFTENKKP